MKTSTKDKKKGLKTKRTNNKMKTTKNGLSKTLASNYYKNSKYFDAKKDKTKQPPANFLNIQTKSDQTLSFQKSKNKGLVKSSIHLPPLEIPKSDSFFNHIIGLQSN